MFLLGQRLQGFYPMFQEFSEERRIHATPVEPFVVTGVHEVPQTILQPLRVRKAGLDEGWTTFEKDAVYAIKRLGTRVIETSTKPFSINHGRRVEEGVALVDRDQVKPTGNRVPQWRPALTGSSKAYWAVRSRANSSPTTTQNGSAIRNPLARSRAWDTASATHTAVDC